MNKLASLVGAGVLLLVMAAPALACYGPYCWWQGGDGDVTINNNAWVSSTVKTKANTGYNSSWFGGKVFTGPAAATAMVTNGMNGSMVGCDCVDDVTINNNAWVSSTVKTKANTGYNSAGMFGGMIGTGGANASSFVSNFVNTTMVGE